MLGLLEKDLRLTLARKESLLIFFVLAIVMGISIDGSFIVGYSTMLAMILAVGTISYDEFDNGFPFLMTLPFDRKTYVREKYVFCLCMAVAAWCIGTILYCIVSAFRHNAVDLTAELPSLLTLIPTLYFTATIMIPLHLKYGAEKSRIALFVIFGIIAVLIAGSNRLFEGSSIELDYNAALSEFSPFVVLLVFILVSAVFAFISYLCSVRIMEKKEF